MTEDNSTVDTSENILIADSGCDQTLINNAWTVTEYTNRCVIMLQALQGRHAGEKFPVVQAIAKLSDAHGNDYCAEVNEALYDNNNEQKESLLSVHQARSDGKTAVDDCSKTEMDIRGNHDTQCSRFKDTMLHFFFDGKKCFYKISCITKKGKKQHSHK